MKRIVFIIAFIFLLALPVCADTYSEGIEDSGIASLHDSLSDSAKEFFEGNDISVYDSGWVEKITAGNVFSWMLDSLKDGGRTPLLTAAAVLGLIILIAVGRIFSNKADADLSLTFIGSAVCTGAVLMPLFSVITAAARTLKGGADFMLAFIPIYGGVLFASGRPLTSVSSSALLLGMSEVVVFIASNFITPLLGSYLAVCMCGNISPIINITGIVEFIKKAASWLLGFILTVYTGVLGIQTAVQAAADNLALKTGRFMLGSFIPVVGGPVSEALNTVLAGASLLRSSVGAYGLVGMALLTLPCLLELFVWRIVLLLCSSAATLFDCGKISAVLKAADSAVSLIIGVILLCSVAFILSLSAVMTAGG